MTRSGNGAPAGETSGGDATTRLTAAAVGDRAAGRCRTSACSSPAAANAAPAGRAGKAATPKP